MKDPVSAEDLPAKCRRWDDKRRVWVAKQRFATAADADAVARTDKTLSAYKCPASSVGQHFHVGRTKGPRHKRRR